ncbi:hypothetical protein EIMP300_23710 [Escherichia coli]|uniref:Glycolate oxidase subunit n=1 Tax=Escherichia coli TaxID=562 RepID=A0A8S0FL24_ECOLX|nr:hypothetical protein EIMP300_23710 [Escherichia coli]
MLRECDYSQALLEQVNQAISDKTPLVIQGSNSKAFLGRPVTGQTLDVRCPWRAARCSVQRNHRSIAALLITTRPSW